MDSNKLNMKTVITVILISLSFLTQAQVYNGTNLSTTNPSVNAKGQIVRQAPATLWRCSFSEVGSGLIAPLMTTLQTGSGMAVSQASGNLIVTTGASANSETIFKSVKSFSGAFTARFKTTLSQRIANNNFSYELADLIGEGLSYTINSATSVTVTFTNNPFTSANVGQFMYLSVIAGASGIPGRFAIASVAGQTVTYTVAGWPASGSGTLTIWGWNYHRVLYTGTTATSALVDAQRKGWASGDATITTVTSASPGHVVQTVSDGSMVGYSDALVATNAAVQFTARGSRIENIPDADENLFLFIRVLNGTTNPATTTTFTIGFLSVEEFTNNKVLIAGGEQSGANYGVGVNVLNTPATTVTGTINQGTAAAIGSAWPTYLSGKNINGNTSTAVNSAATTNAAFAKASAGTIYSISAMNTSAATKYVRIYNKASAPTVGTDVPVLVIAIPATSSKELSFGVGLTFGTGIAYAITNAAGVTDATAVVAGDVQLLINWQ